MSLQSTLITDQNIAAEASVLIYTNASGMTQLAEPHVLLSGLAGAGNYVIGVRYSDGTTNYQTEYGTVTVADGVTTLNVAIRPMRVINGGSLTLLLTGQSSDVAVDGTVQIEGGPLRPTSSGRTLAVGTDNRAEADAAGTRAAVGLAAADLDAQLDAISGASMGAGADRVTITWTNSTTGFPVADGDVWITSDAAGTNVVAGTLQTDSAGNATFMLDAGTIYFFWGQKDGVNPKLGESFVAVAD